LFFEDVRLPASALLGEENKGFYYLMNELPQERLLIGVHACAQSEFMFEETKQYVMQRKAYGKTLSNLQVHGHNLSFTHLECATLYNLTFLHRRFNINSPR
jgi:long-chain-acyl-CoA dehydrogenase